MNKVSLYPSVLWTNLSCVWILILSVSCIQLPAGPLQPPQPEPPGVCGLSKVVGGERGLVVNSDIQPVESVGSNLNP